MIEEYDVCIVGTGPAGAFAANKIAKKGYKVLMLEAGNNHVNSEVGSNIDLYDDRYNSLDFGFSQQVGGSSNLWAGGLAKLDNIDFEERKEFNFLSWPLKLNQMNDYYSRVNEMIGIHNSDLESAQSRTLFSAYGSNIELKKMIVLDAPYKTRELVEGVENIDLFKNHSVFRVNLKESNDSIASIEALNTASDTKHEFKAKFYILAAGSINNIRILLHSLKSLQEEKPHMYNSIGKFFSTHPKSYIGKITFNNDNFSSNHLLKIKKGDGYFYKYQLGLTSDFLRRKGLLNHSLRVESKHALRIYRFLDYFKKILKFNLFKNSPLLIDTFVEIGVKIFKLLEVVDLRQKKSFYLVRGFFDQSAREDNCISLSSKESESGLPLAHINWNFESSDWENVERYIECIKDELEKNNIGALSYLKPSEKNFSGIHSHFMGGTRMGSSDKNSIVNQDLRVHGINNLYVSGPSTFPSFSYANPFYTIAALSIRLSDHIIQQLKESSDG